MATPVQSIEKFSQMTMYKFFVYLLAGWSGFFVMALELLGGRALGPFFGTGIYVWGAIITLFMLSLSIGYLIGGSLSASRPSVQKLSAILLLAMLAALPCVMASSPILEFIFDRVAIPAMARCAPRSHFSFCRSRCPGRCPLMLSGCWWTAWEPAARWPAKSFVYRPSAACWARC